MAIVEMLKIRLTGLIDNKDEILDALHKTKCVQVSQAKELDETFVFDNSIKKEEAEKLYQKAVKGISFLEECFYNAKNKTYAKNIAVNFNENYLLSYSEFLSIKDRAKQIEEYISFLEEKEEIFSENKNKTIRLNNLLLSLEPYKALAYNFNSFKNTDKTVVRLGVMPKESTVAFNEFLTLENLSSTILTELSQSETPIMLIVSHLEESDKVLPKLYELGFVDCPFDFDCTAEEKINSIYTEISELEKENDLALKQVIESYKQIKELKIYSDYLKLQLDKELATESLRSTKKTFLLEGYAPIGTEEKIKTAVNLVTDAVFVEFSKPDKSEVPPTLLHNGKAVSQTEFVTDMFSTPTYREIDPNKAVFFFFILFMGIIMADIGYGLTMIALGLLLSSRIKVQNGAKKLWNVIALGGVSTILFGLLFNSFFGFSILPFTLVPSPTPSLEGTINMQTVMTLLLFSLALGVIQISVGYFFKALNSFKNGDVAEGIFSGILWVIFFIGLVFAVFNFLTSYLGIPVNKPVREFFAKVQNPGIYIVIGSLLVIALTAGRREKGFGKISKGFGALYGLINIMSDILSYARLFGLMLSGMIIAQTFNYKLGLPIIQGGGAGIILGSIIIIIGHVFNIAMGVLGAYIHDSRLQYIEFFGRFYSGEGTPFVPLGANSKYICINNAK